MRAPVLLVAFALSACHEARPPASAAPSVATEAAPAERLPALSDEAGEDERGMTVLEACESGIADACSYLVEAVVDEPEHADEAMQLFREVCRAHPVAGCVPLLRVTVGADALRDRALARDQLEAACASEADACIELASSLGGAGWLPSDRPRALELFVRACELGSAVGCNAAATALRHGVGAPIDRARATSFADRSCELGLATGCERAVELRVLGQASPADASAAIGRLRTGCEHGEADACDSLVSIAAMGLVPGMSPEAVDRTYAEHCVPSEEDGCDEAPSSRAFVDPRDTSLCRVAMPSADASAIRERLRARLVARLRAGVVVASELGEDERAHLGGLLGPFGCNEGSAFRLRWMRPLVREDDGAVTAVVEWFAAQYDGGFLHESVVRVAPDASTVVDDASFFWQYPSIGLAGWRRSTRDDFDGDGVPDVAVSVVDGYHDALSGFLVVVTSGARRLERVQLTGEGVFAAEACFVPGAEGPTLFASVTDLRGGDEAPTRSCLAAVTLGRERGARAVPVRAVVAEERSVALDLEADDEREDLAARLRRLARGTTLVGWQTRAGADDVDWEDASVVDEALYRADSRARPIDRCPARFALALVASPAYDDEASPVRVRLATRVAPAEPGTASPAFPESDSPPICDILF